MSSTTYTFGQSVGRAFFGELGDNTFFLTLLLTAWSPAWHSRSSKAGQREWLSPFLAFTSAFLALLIWNIVMSGAPVCTWCAASSFLAASLLIVVSCTLHCQRKPLPPEEERLAQEFQEGSGASPPLGEWNPLASRRSPDAPQWNPLSKKRPLPQELPLQQEQPAATGAEASPFQGDWQQSPYGTVLPSTTEEEQPDWFRLCAFMALSFLLVLFGESADKSNTVLLDTLGPGGALGIISPVLGSFLALCVAGLCGFVLERAVPDQFLLLLVELGFFAVAIMCFSNGALSTRALTRVTEALLQMTSSR